MNNIWLYLTQPYAMFSVTIPWAFVIYWYVSEGRKQPLNTKLLLHWMLLVVCTYNLTMWELSDEHIALHMIDAFFIYLAFYLWLGLKITPGAAYVLTFLNEWTVDMAKARELIGTGLVDDSTYYFGIGGAGYLDGLCIFPLIAAALVHYVAWRRKEKGPSGPF